MSCALKVPRLNLADAATPRRRPRVGCVDRVRLVYGRPRGDPRRHAQPGRGSLRETVAPWVVALLASGALVLFVELNPTKPDHHTIGVKIGAGVVTWLGVAAIVRFIIFAADQARTR